MEINPAFAAAGKPLAIVNNKAITEDDVNQALAQMGQAAQNYNNPQGRAAILEQLIAQKLFLADAMHNVYEREPAFKAEMAKIKEQLLTQYAISKAVDSLTVTDAEARKYFNENPDAFQGEPTVSASHILVSSEEEANRILAYIQAGAVSFEDAAKQYSSCPSSANGGSLGEFGQGQMVPEFDKAVFSMEVGELRGPVQTQFGYHLIRLDSKNEAKPLSFDDIKENLKGQLLGEKRQKAYQSKVNQLKILYPVQRF